ncbi:MAG TPA: hypothetical protein VNM48_08800, partial [Chloroflexota bacterium]|nr:hypothetical protein [Chloroflexota bacterium]
MIYPEASALWTRAFSPQVCGSVPESRRRVRRPFLPGVLLAALVFLPSLVAPAPAAAHPLGNFTVNRYSRLELSPDRLRIRYVLDAAEIPTFQAMPTLDANGDGQLTDAEKQAHAVRQLAGITANLRLTLDGKAIPLRVTSQELELLPGQAGLQTTRLSGWLDAPEAAAALRQAASSGSAIALEYRDGNEPAKIGWREIVVRAEGVAISPTAGGAPVPTKDVADELRTYPEDMLAGPLDVRDLRLAINPPAMTGAGATGATGGADDARRPAAQSLSRKGDGFAEMFAGAASGTLTPGVIALALLSAVVLGGMHSMSPGHGKTIVGA